MAEAPAHIATIAHPAPHRDRVTLVELAFALAAAPLAWGAQLVIGYGVASHVCFAGSAPRAVPPSWLGAVLLLLVVELIAFVIAAVGAAVAYRLWHATRTEDSGDTHEMVEAGRGRTRFLALWGLMTSLGFAGAVVFSLVGLFEVPLCGY
ncbi:MAG: hypothetical protein ACXWJN_03090 [Methyloceanibacter sp.]